MSAGGPTTSLTGSTTSRSSIATSAVAAVNRWWINKLWETMQWAWFGKSQAWRNAHHVENTAAWIAGDCLEETPMHLEAPTTDAEYLAMLAKHDDNTMRRVLCVAPNITGEELEPLLVEVV